MQRMLRLSGNRLIREHVRWPLPDSRWIIQKLDEMGFVCEVKAHSSVAVWLGQYLAQNLAPDAGKELNKYLIQQHSNEAFTVPLYHLVTGRRISPNSWES